MIRVIRDASSGLIFIDGREDPIAGGLQATLSGDQIAIANVYGGKPIVCTDYSQIADINGAGFASAAAAMAYLATIFAPPPSRTVEAVAGAAIAAGAPLATSRANGQLVPARADTYPLAFVAGVALADAADGFPAQAGRGAITLDDWTSATGNAALAQGQPYFLAPAGGLTATAINPGALCVALIGLAASATTLVVTPSDPILL